MHTLPETGFLRLRQLLGKPATATTPAVPPIIPVSKSTWWAGVRSGRYPKPTRALGVRITAWDVASIRALIEAAAPANDPVALSSMPQAAINTVDCHERLLAEGKGDGR